MTIYPLVAYPGSFEKFCGKIPLVNQKTGIIYGQEDIMVQRELRHEIGKMRVEEKIPIANLVNTYGVSASSISRWSKEYLHDMSEKKAESSNEMEFLANENSRLAHEVDRLNKELDALRTSLIVLAREKDDR